jgi:hypothetical protein
LKEERSVRGEIEVRLVGFDLLRWRLGAVLVLGLREERVAVLERVGHEPTDRAQIRVSHLEPKDEL